MTIDMDSHAAPGSLAIDIRDREVVIEMVGGGSWSIPVGPMTLVERELEHADRPAPEQLTNALGIVTDHLDDVIRESSLVASAAQVTFSGPHAIGFARVEYGSHDVPATHLVGRADAEEVFRTIVVEPIAQRLHNPGLDPDDVETVIGTCCVVLAIMRRLDMPTAAIDGER